MKLLDKNIFNSIKYRIPQDNLKNLSFVNNKSIENTDANCFILKPKGKKCILWFTYYEKDLLCILILLNDNNIYNENNLYYNYDINFDKKLTYNNTLISGIYIKNNDSNYIIIDNIYNYNLFNTIILKNYFNNNIKSKLFIYNTIINCIINNDNYKIFIPLIYNNINKLYKKINTLNYKLYAISVYTENKYIGNFIFNNKISFNSNCITSFKIKSNIKEDIYEMYILNEKNKETFYDYLLIDSYKNSVFMNNLFRNIRENINLDLLEESDNEDDFENINENKFLNNKEHIIDCIYNMKFKKWIPQKISKDKKITTKKNIFYLLNKK
tara:strand:+ start:21570 stop:22547 length:978 start_codon:yes stop_codon:yes gene_type:complete